MKIGYIYFLTNWTNVVLYIGVTSDLIRRISEHKSQALSGFTKTYQLKKLVYYEIYDDIKDAIVREKQLKRWARSKKNALVDKTNPGWDDLFDGSSVRSLDFARDDDKEGLA
jgi:putative endonuclease